MSNSFHQYARTRLRTASTALTDAAFYVGSGATDPQTKKCLETINAARKKVEKAIKIIDMIEGAEK